MVKITVEGTIEYTFFEKKVDNKKRKIVKQTYIDFGIKYKTNRRKK